MNSPKDPQARLGILLLEAMPNLALLEMQDEWRAELLRARAKKGSPLWWGLRAAIGAVESILDVRTEQASSLFCEQEKEYLLD